MFATNLPGVADSPLHGLPGANINRAPSRRRIQNSPAPAGERRRHAAPWRDPCQVGKAMRIASSAERTCVQADWHGEPGVDSSHQSTGGYWTVSRCLEDALGEIETGFTQAGNGKNHVSSSLPVALPLHGFLRVGHQTDPGAGTLYKTQRAAGEKRQAAGLSGGISGSGMAMEMVSGAAPECPCSKSEIGAGIDYFLREHWDLRTNYGCFGGRGARASITILPTESVSTLSRQQKTVKFRPCIQPACRGRRFASPWAAGCPDSAGCRRARQLESIRNTRFPVRTVAHLCRSLHG
jgi:hypothetical protein